MDIPYVVEARPDTGLYNAKVGIWLFLASEVMLFGALFSSYILLRVGAVEGTWPHGWLNVPVGTINTTVLITSSITTVMSWASLKMNQFGRFKVFHACTLCLALTFVGIKSYEYHDKFTHYEVRLNDEVKLKDGKTILGRVGERTADTLMVEQAAGAPGKFLAPTKIPLSQIASIQNGRIADGHILERGSDEVKLHGRVVDRAEALADLHSAEARHAKLEEITIPNSQIARMERYGPWHNTYLAIYFTLTGLHALHVIGGALVIGFLWGPGSRMWQTDPERFTNRVEISGLFWHFVDLVWIFLFPVLYLL
jgi:cytochrome c oxidase subunit III